MDWNNGSSSNFRPPQFFPPRIHDHSCNLLYNYTFQDHYPTVAEVAEHPGTTITNENNGFYHKHADKKKRVSTDQLDSLEKSFQEEIKLDPDRKMRLAKDLGLPPRQVAIWFQNRRARWKAKQLENLYESLKQKFDLVSKEKYKLQQEVLALKAMLHEQAQKKQVSKGYTDVSGEETVESTSDWNRRNTRCHETNRVNYLINDETGDYNSNQVVHPSVGTFWGVNPHQLPF